MKSSVPVLGLLSLLALSPPAFAQEQETPPPMPLEQQEAIQSLDKLQGLIDDLAKATTTATAAKKNECMKAIGITQFCECIAEKSPVGISFVGYVSILAGTKDDFHYDQLSDEDKKLFDATRASRENALVGKEKMKA